MEVQKLHPDVLAKIRSSFAVNTVTQCVIELVLNSLDAKPTAIAVRINLVTFKVQVVDNGEGILDENMDMVGKRYFTNKCHSLEHLEKHLKHFGFRGEALASIIEISKSVNITSRHVRSSKTNSKTWGKHCSNDVVQVRERPSVGTTVTVEGLFYNLPIRRKRIMNELELEEIKNSMESLMIMHPNVSFTIRNDVTRELILDTQKQKDIISSFQYLHPEAGDNFCFLKISKSKLSIDALLFKELSENKRVQYIFVNKRPVYSAKIRKLVSSLFHKFHKTRKEKTVDVVSKHPVYVMNIKCPYSRLDILLNPTKTMVEFKNWNGVQRCIEKLIQSFFGNEIKSQKATEPALPVERIKKDAGISEMSGVFRSYGFKRKQVENEHKTPDKVMRLEDDEDIVEETQKSKKKVLKRATKDLKKIRKVGNIEDFLISLQEKIPKENLVEQDLSVEKELNPEKDSYHISNVTSFDNTRNRRKVKKPLPVKILPKEKRSRHISNREFSAKRNVTPNNQIAMPQRQDDAKSTLSKFTNDQNKGKSLIMNMFLKSTQIFSSDENQANQTELSGSQETVYEEESNFQMENKIQTEVDGVSRAMSVSVNVRSTKKFRRAKKAKEKNCKGVQTSMNENKLISKGLQTTFSCKRLHTRRKQYSSTKKSTINGNYTVVLSDRERAPHFKFVTKNFESLVSNTSENFKLPLQKKCICNCHADTSKFFDFMKGKCNDIGPDFLNEKLTKLSPKKQPHYQNFKDCLSEQYKFDEVKQNLHTKNRNYGNEILENWEGNIRRKHIANVQPVSRSPYFAANEDIRFREYQNRAVYPRFMENFNYPINFYDINCYNPYYQPYSLPQYPYGMDNNFPTHQNQVSRVQTNDNKFCEDYRQNYDSNFSPKKVEDVLPRLNRPEKNNESFEKTFETADWTIGSFGKFKPVRWSTQQEAQNKTDLVFSESPKEDCIPNIDSIINRLSVSQENICQELSIGDILEPENKVEETEPILHTTKNWLHSQALSLLNSQQKVERELEAEKSLLAREFFKWDSQFTEAAKNSSDEIENDWIKKINKFGSSYYINKKTGFTTFYTPKPDEEPFKLARRFELMPKGMSPILKDIKKVDKSLSQNGKDKLLEYIMETYKNELLYIKWQHYLKDVDPKTFFENMYKEKLKMFEDCVPDIATMKKKKDLNDVISFNKILFQNIELIGQVDKKFIAVLEKKNNLLILFDQHAVHERIRLEKLLKIYKDAKSESVEKMMFFVPENDLMLLKKHESYLNFVGLSVEFFTNGINIVQIPMSIYSKFKNEDNSETLNKMIHQLIKEIIELLKTTRGVSFPSLPKLIQNIINMEACRGAIKFGDNLNNKKCLELLKKLSTCDLPFQCAHGRPTLTPLLSLENSGKCFETRVNFKTLQN